GGRRPAAAPACPRHRPGALEKQAADPGRSAAAGPYAERPGGLWLPVIFFREASHIAVPSHRNLTRVRRLRCRWHRLFRRFVSFFTPPPGVPVVRLVAG